MIRNIPEYLYPNAIIATLNEVGRGHLTQSTVHHVPIYNKQYK